MKKLAAILLFSASGLFSQNPYVDSLKRIVNSNQHDSIRYNTLVFISEYYISNKPDTALIVLNQAVAGLNANLKKDGLKEVEKNAYLRTLAGAYNNLGYVNHEYGNIQKALDYYFKCLDMDTKLNDVAGLASDYNNIGYVYYYQNLKEKAIEYYKKSLEIAIKSNNKYSTALSYNNLGAAFKEENKTEEARVYYEKALVIYKELNNKRGIGEILLNMVSFIPDKPENLGVIMQMLRESVQLRREIEDNKGMTDAYYLMGTILYNNKQFEAARSYADSCLWLARKTGFTNPMKNASLLLYKIARDNKDYKVALEHLAQYSTMKDSMMNDETKQAAMQNQLKHEFEIKQVSDSLKFADEARIQEIEMESERKQKYGSFALIGLMAVALMLGFFGYRKIKNANHIISSQKEIVEEKNKEILDSINYAKRLQSAILITPEELKTHFRDSFLLYKPKDIIAGDFYFFEITKPQGKDYVTLIAAADSTGHGVPGALVSVVCANALTRCVKEFGLTDPGRILDKTRNLILETFSKSDKDVKDGMDISFASIEKRAGNDKTIFKWAGANNALWYVEKGELKIINPDKQPIGKVDDPKPFNTHVLELEKGTCVYLFTDGYADQFGGDGGKKMKHQKFKDQVLALNSRGMEEQHNILNSFFEEWKGELEQVDDVCVIGIRL